MNSHANLKVFLKLKLFFVIFLLSTTCFSLVSCNNKNSSNNLLNKNNVKITTSNNPSFNKTSGEFIADEHTIGLWHMNEGKEIVILDDSKSDNAGLLTYTEWTKGLFGNAIKFDGKRSFVEIEESKNKHSLSPLNAITIEFWVYLEAKQMGFVSLVVKDTIAESSGKPSYEIYLNNYKDNEYGYNICFRINTDKGEFTMPADVSWEKYIGSWSYFAATYDGNEMKFYVNSNLLKSEKRSGNLIQNTNPLRFSRKYSHGNLLNGIMDEVRISNVARSEIAIKTYWNEVKKLKNR